MRKTLLLIGLLLAWPLSALAADGLIVLKSSHGVGESIDRAEALFKQKGITVFVRVPHSKGAAGVGIEIPDLELLIFGNPKLGSPLMQSQPTTAIDLPLKMIAWQDADGQVWLAYNDPAWIAQRHGVSDRDAVVAKMTGVLKGLSAKIVGP